MYNTLQYVPEHFVKGMGEILGAPSAVRIKLAASSPSLASLLGAHLLKDGYTDPNTGTLFLGREKENLWNLEASGLDIGRVVFFYEKAMLKDQVCPAGESRIRTDIPMFIGEDGNWHEGRETYTGNKTSIVFDAAKWNIRNEFGPYALLTPGGITVVKDSQKYPTLSKLIDYLDSWSNVPYQLTNTLGFLPAETQNKIRGPWRI